jgi:hypothetical protein
MVPSGRIQHCAESVCLFADPVCRSHEILRLSTYIDSLGCTGFLLRDLFGERGKKDLLLFKINLWEESGED